MAFDIFQKAVLSFYKTTPLNYVAAEDALRPDLAGMKIYEEPIFGIADADSPLFQTLKQPGVVHPDAWLPSDWLPEAKSVISFFLPFTDVVKRTNKAERAVASDEWKHARIEGQLMLNAMGSHLREQLEQAGHAAVFPTTDPRFSPITPLISNWSERHIAYVCGLGTFGISRGLITQKGMAGRFGSVITSAHFSPTPHPYNDPFEYCILCGKCQKNCPVNAIDIQKGVVHGKDQAICAPFVRSTYLPPHGPNQRIRYGCGKCQVGVPCESKIPLSALK